MGSWTGSGPIITGTCSTAAWTLFDLSTAYLWAPVIGCMPDKLDCCPSSFVFAMTTATTTTLTKSATKTPGEFKTTTDTEVLGFGSIGSVIPETALSAIQNDCERGSVDPSICSSLGIVVTPLTANTRGAAGAIITAVAGSGVARCPEDYVSAGSAGCCPFGMTPTSSPSNLPIPACASQLPTPFPAPELTSLGLEPFKPISTATDVIYALQYSITTREYSASEGLSTGAKAGIGAGGGFLVLVAIGAVVYFVRTRKRKQKRAHLRTAGIARTDEVKGGRGGGKNQAIVREGPAELGVGDAGPGARYELASSHGRGDLPTQVQGQDELGVYYTGSPPPVPGTPIYELSNTPRVAYQALTTYQGQGQGQQYGYEAPNNTRWTTYPTSGSGVTGQQQQQHQSYPRY